MNDVKDKLQALFELFSRKLPGKITALEDQWTILRNHFDPEKFRNFHREVHSLCGTCGTYGYHILSRTARKLEVYLKTFLDEKSLTTAQMDQIDNMLIELKNSLAYPPEMQTDFVAQSISEKITNNLVYVIEHDSSFLEDLKQNSYDAGYQIKVLKSISEVTHLTPTTHPVALIIDIDEITDQEHLHLKTFLKHNNKTPLFCISESGSIDTRLKVIRMSPLATYIHKPIDPDYLIKKLDQVSGVVRHEPYRILVVDDSHALAEYYAILLKEAGLITSFITNPLLLIEAINDFMPDLILMDVYMPNCNGLELAMVLRQEERYTRIPIIFLSTEDDRVKQLSALNVGGDDFLTKPIIPQHLIKAVISRAKRSNILNGYMTKDSLTGLLNHTNILQRLDIEFARAKRNNEPLAFVMLDIDHFKSVNDRFGHPMGDKVITKLSSHLISSLRKTDIVGRYGGEEFAIILPNTQLNHAISICENLRESFAHIPFKYENCTFNVTISIGIATSPPLQDVTQLSILADEALYESKSMGRNKVTSHEVNGKLNKHL